jgi:hypothetical protein
VDKDAADKLIEYLDAGLTNEEIVEQMDFLLDGKLLSEEEALDFVEFVRTKRRVH